MEVKKEKNISIKKRKEGFKDKVSAFISPIIEKAGNFLILLDEKVEEIIKKKRRLDTGLDSKHLQDEKELISKNYLNDDTYSEEILKTCESNGVSLGDREVRYRKIILEKNKDLKKRCNQEVL